jgi:hypothetical protein
VESNGPLPIRYLGAALHPAAVEGGHPSGH